MKKIISVSITLFLLFACQNKNTKSTSETINILSISKNSIPLISTRLVFRGGLGLEKNNGEAYLLAKILSQSKMSQLFENHGTTFWARAEYDYFSMGYQVLSQYEETVFSKWINFLRNYKISPKEFYLAKQQLLQELKIQKDDFYHRARYLFYKKLYGPNHYYGKPQSGSFESVKKIKISDIQNYYTKQINLKLAGLILVGNMQKNKLFYRNQLKKLPKKDIRYQSNEVLFSSKEDKRYEVPVPSTQVFVRIGGPGIKRSNPKYLEYMLIADIIGGGFGSIVMKKLREEKGLTYSPVANFYSQRAEKGYFFIAYSTRLQNLHKSLKLVENIFSSLKKNGINKKNFELSRSYLKGTLLQRTETTSGLAALLTEQYIFQLENHFWEKYHEKLNSLKLKDINLLIRKFFSENHFVSIILKPQGK